MGMEMEQVMEGHLLSIGCVLRLSAALETGVVDLWSREHDNLSSTYDGVSGPATVTVPQRCTASQRQGGGRETPS